MKQYNILLVLTGGTICSFDRGDGERASDTHRAETVIVKKFQETHTDTVSFTPSFPLDTLSENMTTAHWNTLIEAFRSYDFSRFDGVIVLHGTDTLAYTASLLALLLAGIQIPVILVSAQRALDDSETNGNENFAAAVSLIKRGAAPNVYTVYRNSDGITYLHLGAHLRQCENGSDDFFSADMSAISSNGAFSHQTRSTEKEPLLYSCGVLTPSVLRIEPYVGLDYEHFSLKKVRAVLHGTYHSATAAVCPDESTSLLSLLRRCDAHGIPLFLSPCDGHSYTYETTGIALRNGAIPLSRMTNEMTYVKLLVGLSLGISREKLSKFLRTEQCGEFIF